MLRRSTFVLDNFKEHYHRIHLPRRIALQRHLEKEAKKAHHQKLSSSADTAAAASATAKYVPEVPYKYNRWWVNNDHNFVHQYAFVEDPDVTREKKAKLPTATADQVWKEPHSPFFLPFAPFIKVVDYAKDSDAKQLKPINVPRWKDYMNRAKPVVPRTWY